MFSIDPSLMLSKKLSSQDNANRSEEATKKQNTEEKKDIKSILKQKTTLLTSFISGEP